jgi:hypothetical protein
LNLLFVPVVAAAGLPGLPLLLTGDDLQDKLHRI